MRVRLILCLVALVLITSSCQAAEPTPKQAGSAGSSHAPTFVPIPTDEPVGEGFACMEALLQGQLVADDATGLAMQAPGGGERTVVVWPNGWVAIDEDGMRVLLNDHGEPIARVGDQIGIGGGQGGDGRWHTCGEVSRLP